MACRRLHRWFVRCSRVVLFTVVRLLRACHRHWVWPSSIPFRGACRRLSPKDCHAHLSSCLSCRLLVNVVGNFTRPGSGFNGFPPRRSFLRCAAAALPFPRTQCRQRTFFPFDTRGERSFQQIGSDQGLFAASFTSGAIPDSGQRRFDQSEWLASPSFRRCKNGIGRYFVPRIANCAALSRSTG